MKTKNTNQTIANNKKAFKDFFISDRYEAGIALKGTEVKSLKNYGGNINDSFARVLNNEIFLFNMHISPYKEGNIYNCDPKRERKLLLHKREISRLWDQIRLKGMTIIPTRMYLKNGLAKLEIAVAKGKRQYDKRQAIAKRDTEREIERHLKNNY